MRPIFQAALLFGAVALFFQGGREYQKEADQKIVRAGLKSSIEDIQENVWQAATRLDVCEQEVQAVKVIAGAAGIDPEPKPENWTAPSTYVKPKHIRMPPPGYACTGIDMRGNCIGKPVKVVPSVHYSEPAPTK